MRKLILVSILMLSIFITTACTNTTTLPTTAAMTTDPVDYRAVIAASVAELDEIVAERGGTTQAALATSLSNRPARMVSRDDEGINTPEEYHEVYDTQRDNSTDVALSEEYQTYAAFLWEVNAIVEQDPDIALGVSFVIESESFGTLNLTLSVVDGFVIIDIDHSTEEYDFHQIYRMGFSDAQAFLFESFGFSRPIGTEEGVGIGYSGFIENDRFMLFSYSDDGYDFQVISDIDDEIICVGVTFGAGEGVLVGEDGEMPQKTTFIRWHDAETDRRTSITYADGEIIDEYYEFFNDHGIWLMYRVPDFHDPANVSVWWSLLEATGWDYVYDDPANDFSSMYVELYKNDERMFSDGSAIVRGYLTQWACLYLVMEQPSAYFTTEVLNLTAFGLSFNHPEITPEALEQVRMQDLAAAIGKAVYQDVDLLGEDARTEMNRFIPAELLSMMND